ncbi:TIGR02450 family Trp-rich protein [Vibrio sp.]|nr:TIGR02450 family Trp-rich protein [Vibrio sp.]
MNNVQPKKLLHSKWTSMTPKQKELHFIIVDVEYDDEGVVCFCEIEAVMTHSKYAINWRELKDSTLWKMGWK